jgi:hypothetical protein
MLNKTVMRWTSLWISLILLLGSTAPCLQSSSIAQAGTSDTTGTYLPMAWKNYPLFSPFGWQLGCSVEYQA